MHSALVIRAPIYVLVVPFFTPHVHDHQLPPVGASIERAVMDWKAVADAHEFSKAKDVAAFANHLGGTLLIGAKERETNGVRDGQLEGYRWYTPAEAGQVRDAFSKAVKNRCLPTPLFDFAELKNPDDSDQRVVVVNVWPSVLLVGVKVAAAKPSEGWGGDAWVYPVRAGTDALFLSPDRIAMYMTPQIRRIAVLLSRIPKRAEVQVLLTNGHSHTPLFSELREEENVVLFENADGTRNATYPLDFITAIYEAWEPNRHRTYWRMHVALGR